MNLLRKGDPVHFWHANVAQEYVNIAIVHVRRIQGFLAIPGHDHLKALIFEIALK